MAGIVQSVQTATITIAANATSGTATITSVDTTRSVERILGWTYPANVANAAKVMPAIDLTNATTVTAQRDTADASNAMTVYVVVTQYTAAAIQSVQRGSTTISSATTATATISSVTTTNSAIQYNGCTTVQTGTVQAHFMCGAQLTNATTVTAIKGTTTSNAVVYWVVCEFKSGILNSSTQQSTVVPTSTTPLDKTITSVTTAQSMLWWGGQSSASTGSSAWCNAGCLKLKDSTHVTGTIDNTPSSGTTLYFTVVEYKSADITSINRATTTIASGTNLTDTTITAVVTANSEPNFLGSTTSATASFNTSWIFPAVTLTSTTNVRVATNSNTVGNTDIVGWELTEYVIASAASTGNMFLVF